MINSWPNFVNQRIIKQNVTKLQSDIWLIQILQWYCHGHFCLPFLEGGNSKYTVTKSFFNIIMALLQLSRYFCWLAYFTLYTMYNFC